MRSALSATDVEHLSELIGAVYDSAIDPSRWDATLEAIRTAFVCANATLYVFDTATLTERLGRVVGVEPRWQRLMVEYGPNIGRIYREIGDGPVGTTGSIFVLRRQLSDAYLEENEYFTKWAKPQGIDDLIQVTVLRERSRLSLLAMGRYERDGRIGEREIELLRLLAPHLRRAVAVADMLDMRTLEAAGLAATLDAVATGVLLVDAGGRIIRSNRAGDEMLERCGLLVDRAGRLGCREPATAARLTEAIAEAAGGAAGAAENGTAIPLLHGGGPLHLAYVIPVGNGQLPSRLLPDAAAAIFLTSGEGVTADLQPVADAFGLTAAEARLLERLARGDTTAAAAAALGIARTTARTHVARILSKTGTRRQADLIALVHRLLPPLRPRG